MDLGLKQKILELTWSGWTDQGIPTKEKLHELQLDFVADELWGSEG